MVRRKPLFTVTCDGEPSWVVAAPNAGRARGIARALMNVASVPAVGVATTVRRATSAETELFRAQAVPLQGDVRLAAMPIRG